MAIVYVALGANLGDPFKQATDAIAAIKTLEGTSVSAVSPFYRSKPLGPQDQPEYLNAVIKLDTVLAPDDLLSRLQTIESTLGRERKDQRWGPRTLDLDILLYGDLIINSSVLTIPHYDMTNREFVLYPLFDIEPTLILPNKIKLVDLIVNTPLNNMVKW